MKILGSSIQQLDKYRADGSDKPKSECRKWRLWVTTDCGRKSRRFGGTYTQAQEALKAFVAELEAFIPNSESFGSYAESWRLWREKSGNYSPVTISEDGRKVRALRRTNLDGMRMDSITPEDCREALLWLKCNKTGGGEYTGTSMRYFHQTLSAIMEQAVDDGKVSSNPMAKIMSPKKDTDERDALSPGEIALLLNRLDSEPLDGKVMAVYLMLCLGLRRGEACALLDSDISGGFCRIHASMRSVDGSIGGPKSKSGVRTLPVGRRLQAKVDEWRSIRKAFGWADRELLCLNVNGDPLRPSMIGQWWINHRSSLGCQGLTLHQLRHSNLSMMARHMGAFDLQRYAGWASIGPAKVYIHDDLDAVVRGAIDAWDSIERTKFAPAKML